MRTLKQILRSILPAPILARLFSTYHFSLAFLGAFAYGFPSRKLTVIGVTGTKGKSSTVEIINAIAEANGRKTALISTIRIKIGEKSSANTMRMSMPGRFYLQRFLSEALYDGCDTVIMEMTSEGARQHRHRFIALDALVFTNLSPEHIESHGSLEAYADAKFSIGLQLVRSPKRPRVVVANADDAQGARYLALPVEHALPFSLAQVEPWHADDHGGSFTFEGTEMRVHLPGEFSLRNALAAATLMRTIGIPREVIRTALENLSYIPGRGERVEAGQAFPVVVDYAHTPDSLKAIYAAYGAYKKICVLGSTGGGRDRWKRPVMGRIAGEMCDHVILTNEDPYDEQPQDIVDEIAAGMQTKPEVVLDRRAAIARAIAIAKEGSAVVITGKGTDPSICGPRGTSVPWSDARVAKEELHAAGYSAKEAILKS